MDINKSTTSPQTSHSDFWDQLPEKVKESIDKAKTQLDNGEGIPHHEVMRKIRRRFLDRR